MGKESALASASCYNLDEYDDGDVAWVLQLTLIDVAAFPNGPVEDVEPQNLVLEYLCYRGCLAFFSHCG
jgi:hypothetical protein